VNWKTSFRGSSLKISRHRSNQVQPLFAVRVGGERGAATWPSRCDLLGRHLEREADHAVRCPAANRRLRRIARFLKPSLMRVCFMRDKSTGSRCTLITAATPKADILNLEDLQHPPRTSLLRFTIPDRCSRSASGKLWLSPYLKRPATRTESTTKTTRIITTGMTTKIAPGGSTYGKPQETSGNFRRRTRRSSRNTGMAPTPIQIRTGKGGTRRTST